MNENTEKLKITYRKVQDREVSIGYTNGILDSLRLQQMLFVEMNSNPLTTCS